MLTLPNMEQRLVKIGEAAKILGTTPGQLRKWETSGELLPTRKTRGGTRYYATHGWRTQAGDWPVHRALAIRRNNKT